MFRVLTLVICGALVTSATDVAELFKIWAKEHNKAYTSDDTRLAAFEAFVTNDRIIREHNAKDEPYELAHNQFSDVTEQQFKAAATPREATQPILLTSCHAVVTTKPQP